ncbi:hypothetical protein B0J14DRAFT_660758 [Halenospora varia]|nr:hypothetical protein B0J14DRAFT_660758 [Halenospora varia]
MSTKTSRNQGLKGRMMWLSAMYADPEKNARRQTFGDGRRQNVWDTSQLITACSAQGLKVYRQEETEEFWVARKRSIGLKGFVPVWERAQPPRLKMLEQTKNQSLDKLEDLMGGFSQEYANDDIQDGGLDISSDNPGAAVGVNERDSSGHRQSRFASSDRSIMAAFARKSNDKGVKGIS